jgi:hypothetical protein
MFYRTVSSRSAIGIHKVAGAEAQHACDAHQCIGRVHG